MLCNKGRKEVYNRGSKGINYALYRCNIGTLLGVGGKHVDKVLVAVVEEVIEEVAEVKVCLEGCTLEEGHEGECVVKKEEIEVILKTTSMERDLKVKFVNKKTLTPTL